MTRLFLKQEHCFVPPYMHEHIYKNGSSIQKERARIMINLSEQMRESRQFYESGYQSLMWNATVTKSRLVYDAKNQSVLPGVLMRNEGSLSAGDDAIDEAYDGSGYACDLFSEVYGRNSLDGRGMPVISTVHYLTGYDNAFWNGGQIVLGDGDDDLPREERIFNRFTVADDIIAHEFAHGVTQYEAGLHYYGQSGALNESVSDVFGILAKQRKLGHTVDQSEWYIGEGLFTSRVNARGIRSMSNPGSAYDDPVLGKDPQPGHMDNYIDTWADNGGVHINSGIANRAFYFAAMEIGGYGWERAGLIWYIALRDRFGTKTTFNEAAFILSDISGELFGTGSNEQRAVNYAWEKVGVKKGV